jgi:hypothetical protein
MYDSQGSDRHPEVGMVDDLIPADVRDFLVNYIDSIAQLEALLLLRASPGERWTAEVVASRLYVDAPVAEAELARLCAHSLISCQDSVYSYAGNNAELNSVVDRLAVLYARHLIPVTNLIHAKRGRIREFASAFRLRKDT